MSLCQSAGLAYSCELLLARCRAMRRSGWESAGEARAQDGALEEGAGAVRLRGEAVRFCGRRCRGYGEKARDGGRYDGFGGGRAGRHLRVTREGYPCPTRFRVSSKVFFPRSV